jgi:hypothetical protein
MILLALYRQTPGLFATVFQKISFPNMRFFFAARRGYSTFLGDATATKSAVLRETVPSTAVHTKMNCQLSQRHVSHPVLDFRSISKKAPANLRKQGLDILDNAFRKHGFIHLSHHEIPQGLVDAAFDWVCCIKATFGQHERRQLTTQDNSLFRLPLHHQIPRAAFNQSF